MIAFNSLSALDCNTPSSVEVLCTSNAAEVLIDGLSLLCHAILRAPPRDIGPSFSRNQSMSLDLVSEAVTCVFVAFQLLIFALHKQSQYAGFAQLAGRLEVILKEWSVVVNIGVRKQLAGFMSRLNGFGWFNFFFLHQSIPDWVRGS